ncbi:MAG: glycosyltransferase [Flavobacteriia bacterium]|nr:glycosyltransferase [Flavobacteriia bacterium]
MREKGDERLKSIVITGFNRPRLLENCLESVFNARGSQNFKKIVFLQYGDDKSRKVIENYADSLDTLIGTHPSGKSVDARITNNRLTGLFLGFEYWKSEYVVSLEDDVSISEDALEFIESCYERYSKNRKFRGVNLGSKLPFTEREKTTFSLLRYGIHGPASMITRETWNRLNVKKLLKHDEIIFDAQIEFELKSGFMATPNCSRYLDQGFQGTHFIGSETDEYFWKLSGSFVGDRVPENSQYTLRNLEPNWRKDCKTYTSRNNYYYSLKAILYKLSYHFPQLLEVKRFFRRNKS